MKITIVLGAFFPVPPVMGGAIEKAWWALARDFARRGHEVTLISRMFPPFPTRETLDGVKHVRVKGFDSPRSLVWLKVLDLLYSLRARAVLPTADILVTNTFWLPLFRGRGGTGKVYVHVARYPKGQMRFYKNADRLQAVSHSIGNAIMAEAPALAPKVRVIPHALPFEFPADVPAERNCTLLYVGRIHPEKGLELLLKAAAKLSPEIVTRWTLEIVGPDEVRLGGGGETFARRLDQLAEHSALKVKRVGPVFDEEKLADHYRSARLFIYPSVAEKGEALPVAPLEAMANGCVPIVSSLACFKDYIEDGVSGFVFDHRSSKADEHLAARLTDILQMDAELDRMAAAARRRVQQFATGVVAEEYLADFRSLADTHG